ncbi:Uncharacterized membrane protein YfcA [Modicisalibacter muralis]|uniref:Probable membrane transporter protein n=1 Tax=Modicisalibacter muralis TaxID=119000 RepID=A0A1G9LMM9_9GAMM|nr:TSUP family transporter [Halomonas muralis]SDL63222.1 Uncharacterized membrane protein YfcA [Halomonas muralis]
MDNYSLPLLLIFLGSAALGSYFQAITGFALGIIVLAIMILTGAVTVADTANALSILTFCNVSVVLPQIWRHIYWRGILLMSFGLLPGLIGGVLLLEHLSSSSSVLLRLLVGLLVISSGAFLLLRPRSLSEPSGAFSFGASGVASGVLGGLFSLPGPPVIYHYYRQPITLTMVRATLLTTFALISAGRLLAVASQSGLTVVSVQIGFLAVPVVAIASWAYTRFPPKLSEHTVRRGAALMLVVMGGFIVYMAMQDI